MQIFVMLLNLVIDLLLILAVANGTDVLKLTDTK